MYSIVSLCVAVLLLSGLSEQSPCSSYSLPAVQPFYPGAALPVKVWHLIATDDVGLPYHDFDCIRFHHLVVGFGQIRTTEYAKNLTTNKREIATSYMTFSGQSGNYEYQTAGIPVQSTKIILTDSMTYYVEVSCVDGGEAKFYIGIFSAFPTMDTYRLNTIKQFLEGRQINTSSLRFVEQLNCF